MSKIASAAALSLLLLAACGSREGASGQNEIVEAEADSPENASPSDPAPPAAPADGVVEPVPPPDAVSHPDGYLPPAPAEPGPASADPSASKGSPPATEDEYLRNGQAGR